jgi:hypothetical protein
MSINLTTHKRLWANSGRECAYPGCQQPLLVPLESSDEEIAVGRECHIVAKSDDGPRAPNSLQPGQLSRWDTLIADRDGYANLVLMCGMHHDLIDADVDAFPIERLVRIKREHEQSVSDRMSQSERSKDAKEVRYAEIVDEWARRIDIDKWSSRMSRVVSDAAIREDVFDELEPVRAWLLSRVWPRTLPRLEEAFLNFRLISEDLEGVISWFSTTQNGLILVDRVYKEVSGPQASPENIDFLERRSEYFQDLAADLSVEMTRAVNLICDRVRDELWPNYRLAEGYTTIGLGMDRSLRYETLRPLYDVEPPDRPYEGLKDFVTARAGRSWARGEGEPPDGAGLPGLR